MATRVIDNKRDRLTTILVAPLMTCSARIPVYTLIIGAFIPDREVWGFVGLQGLVMFGLYAAGIVGALAVSFVAQAHLLARRRASPSCWSCPTTRCRAPRASPIGLWTRATIFLKRAGTTILSMMVLIWLLASFPRPPEGATEPAINYSLAAMIGSAMQPLTAPLGFNWQINVALIPGMAAREVAVGALGTIYAIDGGEGAAEQDRPGARRPMEPRPRRWRCSPGTSSRRSAPRPWPSSVARPAAGSGCGSPSPTCWRWPMSRRWPPTRSPAPWAPADDTSNRASRRQPSSHGRRPEVPMSKQQRRTFRYWLQQLHLWIGLILLLPLVMMGMTGAVLVYAHDIEHLLGQGEPPAKAVGEWRSPGRADRGGAHGANDPARIPIAVRWPMEVGEPAAVRLSRPGMASERPQFRGGQPRAGRRSQGGQGQAQGRVPTQSPFAGSLQILIDPVSLQVLETQQAMTGWVRFFHDLHGHLFIAGGLGRELVGWLGVAHARAGLLGPLSVVAAGPASGRRPSPCAARPRACASIASCMAPSASGAWCCSWW